jgi:hypothetical protein
MSCLTLRSLSGHGLMQVANIIMHYLGEHYMGSYPISFWGKMALSALLPIKTSYTLYVRNWRISHHLQRLQLLFGDCHRIPMESHWTITDRFRISLILEYSKFSNSLQDEVHTLTFKYVKAISLLHSRKLLQQTEVLSRHHRFKFGNQHPYCFNLFFYMCLPF